MAGPNRGLGAATLACAIAWTLGVAPEDAARSAASAQPASQASAEGSAKQDAPAAGVDGTGLASSDPLERARAVAALGDARVLARLAGPSGEPALTLAAIRSTPWLSEPALALSPLIKISSGRDPDLAPAAAQALVEIARGLVERPRLSESVTADKLAAWVQELSAVEQSARVRADIRLAAVQAAALLGAARERL